MNNAHNNISDTKAFIALVAIAVLVTLTVLGFLGLTTVYALNSPTDEFVRTSADGFCEIVTVRVEALMSDADLAQYAAQQPASIVGVRACGVSVPR